MQITSCSDIEFPSKKNKWKIKFWPETHKLCNNYSHNFSKIFFSEAGFLDDKKEVQFSSSLCNPSVKRKDEKEEIYFKNFFPIFSVRATRSRNKKSPINNLFIFLALVLQKKHFLDSFCFGCADNKFLVSLFIHRILSTCFSFTHF